MRKAEITLYTFEELPEKVQEKIIERNRYAYMAAFEEDLENIGKLAEELNLQVFNDSRSYIGFYRFETHYFDRDILKLQGKRAVAYIYNNYIEPNMANYTRYRFNPERNKYIKYKSKLSKVFDWLITGHYTDNIIFDAFEQFKNDLRKHPYLTMADFFENLSHETKMLLGGSYNFLTSDEFIREILEERETEYFIDGEIFKPAKRIERTA